MSACEATQGCADWQTLRFLLWGGEVQGCMHVMRDRQGSVALCTGPAHGIFSMKCSILASTQGWSKDFSGRLAARGAQQVKAGLSMLQYVRLAFEPWQHTITGSLCKRGIQSAMC